jgi:hypothetical protein
MLKDLANKAPDEITEAMNLACGEPDEPADKFIAECAKRVLERIEWS